MKTRLWGFALCALLASTAQAEGVAVYLNGGTTGFGGGVATGGDKLSTRLSLNGWNKTITQSDSNGDYTGNLKLQSFLALVDWYPASGTFRTTFGLAANGNKATMTANSTSGFYTFNGTQYAVGEVSSFTAEVKFNTIAPYLGVGWGNPVATGKGWGFIMDLGILFQGSPKVTSTVTCGVTAQCAQLQSDVAAGAAQLEEDLKDFKYYPVVSLGVSYHF